MTRLALVSVGVLCIAAAAILAKQGRDAFVWPMLVGLALLMASCAAPCDPQSWQRTTFAQPGLPGCDIDWMGRYVQPKDRRPL